MLAFEVLHQIADCHIERDDTLYQTAMTACRGPYGQWEWALQLLRDIRDGRVAGCTKSYNSAMGACGMRGQLDRALQIFHDMGEASAEKDALTYSVVSSACTRSGRWQLALHCWRELDEGRVEKDAMAYNNAVAAALLRRE
mmetsp:Transcript_61193/g.155460  ORF Transcript_61193/g.155460 Transcript_61193/m.155460 type:complete len:141 (-) Transcript_61193:12-434(-)